MRDGTRVVIQEERDIDGKRKESKNEFSAGVWQESTLGSATFCVALWNSVSDSLDEVNATRRQGLSRTRTTS